MEQIDRDAKRIADLIGSDNVGAVRLWGEIIKDLKRWEVIVIRDKIGKLAKLS